jgi:hypothetical protein
MVHLGELTTRDIECEDFGIILQDREFQCSALAPLAHQLLQMSQVVAPKRNSRAATGIVGQLLDDSFQKFSGSLFSHFGHECAEEWSDGLGLDFSLLEQWKRKRHVVIIPLDKFCFSPGLSCRVIGIQCGQSNISILETKHSMSPEYLRLRIPADAIQTNPKET